MLLADFPVFVIICMSSFMQCVAVPYDDAAVGSERELKCCSIEFSGIQAGTVGFLAELGSVQPQPKAGLGVFGGDCTALH